jgi:pimeloyl-ACP methyl ester carboxylesterase
MAADLEAYMDAKGLNTAVILGHSMGGKTAMHFAVSRPERVRALVVVDIAPKAYPIHHQGYINAMKSVDFDAVHSRSSVDAILAKSVDNAGIRQFFMKSLHWQSKEKLAFRFNLDALEDQLQEVGTPLEFGYFDRPTLFIAGGASGYITVEDEDAILEHFPAAQIATIANAGHWVHAEAREPFSELVIDFLKDLV